MVFQNITKWFRGLKKHLFTYKDGFFELPFMANSPTVMVESLKKMPFNKHSPDNQTINTNNPFAKATLHYQNFEEGLGIIITDIKFKANCSFIAVYDDDLPKDSFFMTLQISHNKYPANTLFTSELRYLLKGWAFHKPAQKMQNYYFKGNSGLFFNIIFFSPLTNFLLNL